MNLNQLTIKQAHQGLEKKEFSSVQLTEAVLNQIKAKDQEIHAFLSLAESLALAQAEAVDKKIAQGIKIGDLEGIPVAVKDNILVQGEKCTAASKILENYVAPYDATVIEKLKQAGAVIVGKTNLDEFAMGGSTENSAYGLTKNPHDLARVAGGSSGGSAAAVAAAECIYALGSDTGGSIRQPASFCGVVGLKPTYGRVSRSGLMAMASSLDQIGPITKSAEDAEIVLKVIEGSDRFDSTSMNFNQKKDFNIAGLKIGLPREYFVAGLDKEIELAVKKTVARIEEMGAQVEEISLPHTEYALAAYYIVMPAEVSSNLARYDGVRYGLSLAGQDLWQGYFKTKATGFGHEVRRRIMLGTYILSAGYYDAYYLKAQKVRNLIKQDFEKAFKQVDLIMTPTTPSSAFKIGEKTDDPLKMYLEDIYTVSINLAGVPAISLPCGSSANLPIGLQIIGNYFEEEKILKTAQIIEQTE